MASRTPATLWAGRLSMTTTSFGCRSGHSICSHQAKKASPSMGPSSTIGARMPDRVSPPTKVVVFQCPCGTAARQRCPLGAQPRRRAIFVDRPLSSTKTRCLGSSGGCPSNDAGRRAFARTRPASRACASSTEPFGLPCLAGLTAPVARFSRAHAPAVAIPTENRAAACRVDNPPSTAAITRSRKSMLNGLPIRISPPMQDESNHKPTQPGIPSDSQFREDALGAARSRSEMTHEEALPGGAFEIRNRDMRAGIDVHGFLGRAEGIEERDAALARRHGVLPLKDELKRNGNRLGGILEGGLPGAQARKSEHGAFDARFAGDEWYADRRSHGNAPISDAFVPADERESLDRIEGGLPFRHGLLGSFRHGLQHVGGEACAGLAAHARADLRRELGSLLPADAVAMPRCVD